MILYFKRKGDNLYRIGLFLFSYHLFLYREIALIFSQSCITPGPEDCVVTVSLPFSNREILSHLEINPSVDKPHKLKAEMWSQARYKEGSLMVPGCAYHSNPIFTIRIQGKGVATGLHLFPYAELRGYAFLLFLF